MRLSLHLFLPRDVDSVPAVRRLLRAALAVLHVDRRCGDDLEIALTEACSNVVQHAGGTGQYEVRLDVADGLCAIDVLDDGDGFDVPDSAPEQPRADSERGRGLFLIRALSENVRMHSGPRAGSRIHFEKSFA